MPKLGLGIGWLGGERFLDQACLSNRYSRARVFGLIEVQWIEAGVGSVSIYGGEVGVEWVRVGECGRGRATGSPLRATYHNPMSFTTFITISLHIPLYAPFAPIPWYH